MAGELLGRVRELVRRLTRIAGVSAWEQLSPHSLRHSAITFYQFRHWAASAKS